MRDVDKQMVIRAIMLAEKEERERIKQKFSFIDRIALWFLGLKKEEIERMERYNETS